MNTLLIPLLILYLVLLALYVHGRLTLRDRIVRECAAVVSESDLKELVGRLGGVAAFGSDVNLFTRQFREWNKMQAK